MPRPCSWWGPAGRRGTAGYAIEQLLKVLPLGGLLGWTFRLPYFGEAFNRFYRWFARNRYKFGCGEHCALRPQQLDFRRPGRSRLTVRIAWTGKSGAKWGKLKDARWRERGGATMQAAPPLRFRLIDPEGDAKVTFLASVRQSSNPQQGRPGWRSPPARHPSPTLAKYDALCASSGAKGPAAPAPAGIGSTEGTGICHSYTPDGRCVSLLKILLTNVCIFDCAYCINRRSATCGGREFDGGRGGIAHARLLPPQLHRGPVPCRARPTVVPWGSGGNW